MNPCEGTKKVGKWDPPRSERDAAQQGCSRDATTDDSKLYVDENVHFMDTRVCVYRTRGRGH